MNIHEIPPCVMKYLKEDFLGWGDKWTRASWKHIHSPGCCAIHENILYQDFKTMQKHCYNTWHSYTWFDYIENREPAFFVLTPPQRVSPMTVLQRRHWNIFSRENYYKKEEHRRLQWFLLEKGLTGI